MKKSNYILILLTFVAFSCAKLKETPQSFITQPQFYKTPTDAQQAVTACYFWLTVGDASTLGGSVNQTPYNVLFSTGMEMMTDDIDPGPGATNPDVRSQSVLQHNSSGLRVLQIWQFCYAAIRASNIAVDNIRLISFGTQTALKNQYKAEAKVLRALWYFNLVRLYGAVPLVLHDQDVYNAAAIQVSRNPVDSVYAQIIRDLTYGIDSLPPSYTGANVGRVTSGAATALLSKVYLTQRNWQEAATTAEKVISSGVYTLQTNYSTVFLPQYKNGTETILAAQFKENSQGQGNGNAPRGFRSGVPGYTASYADQLRYYHADTGTTNPAIDDFFSIYKYYNLNDQRRKYSFVTNILGSDGKYYSTLNAPTIKGSQGDTVPFLNKYFDPTVGSQLSESGANVHIIRYAEVLLIAAEAENELGNIGTAAGYLDQVRKRANNNVANDIDFSVLSKVQFRDSVYLERRLELVWEWQRWFDLIREIGDPSEPAPVIVNGYGTGQGLTFSGANDPHPLGGSGILYNSLQLVGKTSVEVPKHYLYPIPLQEIQLNPNLTQNPGW